MPSIRYMNLKAVYDSIATSFHGEWELIIVSPYPLPAELTDKTNITYIHDAGNPIRCRQRGLIAAKGDYICYAADDVIFYPNALDIAYNKVKDMDYKTVIVGKYMEGVEDNKFMQSDEYYVLTTHDFLRDVMQKFPEGYKLVNTGLVSRKLMLELGGFDCQFEACAMACVDLSIRLQNYGCNLIMQNEPFFHSTHFYGQSGDHAPIHNAQVNHDQPLFLQIYGQAESVNRKEIDINNWESVPDHWSRRFGVK